MVKARRESRRSSYRIILSAVRKAFYKQGRLPLNATEKQVITEICRTPVVRIAVAVDGSGRRLKTRVTNVFLGKAEKK